MVLITTESRSSGGNKIVFMQNVYKNKLAPIFLAVITDCLFSAIFQTQFNSLKLLHMLSSKLSYNLFHMLSSDEIHKSQVLQLHVCFQGSVSNSETF